MNDVDHVNKEERRSHFEQNQNQAVVIVSWGETCSCKHDGNVTYASDISYRIMAKCGILPFVEWLCWAFRSQLGTWKQQTHIILGIKHD